MPERKVYPIVWNDGHSGIIEVRIGDTAEKAEEIIRSMIAESSEDSANWKRTGNLWINQDSWIEKCSPVPIEK